MCVGGVERVAVRFAVPGKGETVLDGLLWPCLEISMCCSLKVVIKRKKVMDYQRSPA